MKKIPNYPLKKYREIQGITRNKIVCAAPIGCEQQQTPFAGPGASLCREHQLNMVEWGGNGTLKRPYTLHKILTCDECGYDPCTDERYLSIPDKALRKQAMRGAIVCDHTTRRADGGPDTKDNIRNLCHNCNNIKTTINKDNRPRTIKKV